MNCVCCGSAAVIERPEVTARGYRRFRCRTCGRQFNERSGGVLNRACLPSDIIAFVVFCRLRYRLTLRDLSEIMGLRGIEVSHEAVRDWEAKLLPVMGDALRKCRHDMRRCSGASWHADETYLKVRGRWTYLYRAIDRDGNLVDAMLSEHRALKAAKAFFRSARATMGIRPDQVTTDGHGSYPTAIRTVLGQRVRHRTSAYLNNRLEQDHRGIKGRIRCMRDFKSYDAAGRFCREHGELRNRRHRRHNQVVSASLRRSRFAKRRPRCARDHEERVTQQSPITNDQNSSAGADKTEKSILERAEDIIELEKDRAEGVMNESRHSKNLRGHRYDCGYWEGLIYALSTINALTVQAEF